MSLNLLSVGLLGAVSLNTLLARRTIKPVLKISKTGCYNCLDEYTSPAYTKIGWGEHTALDPNG